MANSPHPGYQTDGEEHDVQQKFGYAVWVWTIGSALLIIAGLVMLALSLGGYWSNDYVAPPV